MMFLLPHEYPHRILLAVSGLSPQIVTETLFALSQQPEPFVPTEIHIITTGIGAHKARQKLCEEKQIEKLCLDYGLETPKFNNEHIHLLHDSQGNLVADIITEQNNEQLADFITAQLQGIIEHYDEQCAIHFSIAGGRKTMSFYAGYIMSLLGRPQDRLSHVLVSENYEFAPDFFYPSVNDSFINITHPKTKEMLTLNTKDAQVTLADIPFVRLSHGFKKGFLSDKLTFSTLVQAAQKATYGHSYLEIVTEPHPSKRLKVIRILANDIEIGLEPADAAFYKLIVSTAFDNNDIQILRPKRNQKPKPAHQVMTQRYMLEYEKVGLEGDVEKAHERYSANLNTMTENDFDQRLTAIKNAFIQHLGLEGATPFIPIKTGNGKPYVLPLNSTNITLNN